MEFIERFKKSSKSYEDWEMDSWLSNKGDNWFLTKANTCGQSAFTLKDRVQSTIKVVKVERTLNISRTLKQMHYIVMTWKHFGSEENTFGCFH